MTAEIAPHIHFFSGRSEAFIQVGPEWRRATAEEEGRLHTGYTRDSHEPSVGVYIVPRPNRLFRIGFDLWKLDVSLRPEIVERMKTRWSAEAASFSKSLLKSASRRSHFSKTFAQLEVSPAHLEGWKEELAALLSNPASYTPIERGPHHG
jgi:hypothetical protein